MLSEPMTLYKLMILYTLKRANLPLTGALISDFFLGREYTTYFTLNQALNELIESELIHVETSHNSSRYEITREGKETLSFFNEKISSGIIKDIDQYLKENKFRLRDEIDVTADYYKSTNRDYVVLCEVREGAGRLIKLELSVPDKEQAEIMCGHWKDKSQEVYAFAMKALMSD